MQDHRQEVIDRFAKAILPIILRNGIVYEQIYDDIDEVFSLAEDFYERHRRTCKICEANKEQEVPYKKRGLPSYDEAIDWFAEDKEIK